MSPVAEHVNVWRCTSCGKWSHAKARPRYHERFIANEEPLERGDDETVARTVAAGLGLVVLREVEPSWSGDPNTIGDPGGVWVQCGPFDRWLAVRQEQHAGAAA